MKCIKKIVSMMVVMGLTLNPFLGYLPVRAAEEYTLTNVNAQDELFLDLDTTQTISLEGAGYTLVGCDSMATLGWGQASIVELNFDNGVCEVTGAQYGREQIRLSVKDDAHQIKSHSINVDVELEEYLTQVLALIPNEIIVNSSNIYNLNEQLPKFKNVDYTYSIWDSTCPNNNNQYCVEMKVSYHQPVIDYPEGYNWEEHGKNYVFAKSKPIVIKAPGMINFPNQYIVILGQTNNFPLEFYQGDYKDLYWSVDDTSIATVNQRGYIKGVKIGTTTLRVLDRKNNTEYQTKLIVRKNYDANITALLEHFEEPVDINVGTHSIFKDNHMTNYITADTVNYTSIADRYLRLKYEEMVPTGHYYLGNITEGEAPNKVNVELMQWDNKGSYLPIPVTVEINLTGAILVPNYGEYQWNATLGEPFTLEVRNFDAPIVDYYWDYDADEFEQPDSVGAPDTFVAKKVGGKPIKLMSSTDEIISIAKVKVAIDNTTYSTINDYLNSNRIIELPYNSLDFNIFTDAKLLETIIKNKIMTNFPINDLKAYLNVNVSCITHNRCNASMEVKDLDTFQSNWGPNYITVNYANTEPLLASLIKKIDNNISNKYSVDFDATMLLEKAVNSDENDFYNGLINLTNIPGFVSEEGLTITSKNVSRTKINGLYGSETKDLVFSLGANEIFTKTVSIYADYIMDLPAGNTPNKVAYAKDYLSELFNDDVTVTEGAEYYQADVSGTNINFIISQKDNVTAQGINLEQKIYETSIGVTKKIDYKVYPLDANVFNISFKSLNEDVATVSDDGVITGVGRGYAFIEIKVRSNWVNTTRALVVVDMSIQEALNDIINKLNTDITINYGQVSYLNLVDAAKDTLIQSIPEYYNGYPFEVETYEENNVIYAKLVYYPNGNWNPALLSSESKAINYDFKGIKVDNVLNLSVGEIKDANLSFTEGTLADLRATFEKNIIEYNNGVIKALEPGFTYVNIFDKEHHYWNSIKVYVDFENYFEEKMNEFMTEPLVLEAANINFEDEWSLRNQVEVTLSNHFGYFYGFSVTSCNESAKTCELEIDYQDEGITILGNYTIAYVLSGIKIQERVIEVAVSETKNFDYTYYTNGEPTTYISSDKPEICNVDPSAKTVTGVSRGECTITISTAPGEKNYIRVIVDKEGILEAYQNALEVIDEINLSAPAYDEERAQVDNDYYSVYYSLAKSKIEAQLGLAGNFNLDIIYTSNKNELAVKITAYTIVPSYSSNGNWSEWYQIGETTEKAILINYKEEVPEGMGDISLITAEIKASYELTMADYLKMKIKDEFALWKYCTEFMNIVNNLPAGYKMGFEPMGGMGDTGFMHEGGVYWLTFDDYLADFGGVSFSVYFDLEEKVYETEESLLEAVKEEVIKSYLAAQEPVAAPFFIRLFSPAAAPVVPNVDVSLGLSEDTHTPVFFVNVDAISFTLSAQGYTVTGRRVTGVDVDASNISLAVGDSRTMLATIYPIDASDQTVTWTTNNAGVATVNNSGLIKAIGPGTASITVKTNDGNFTKTINVTVTASITTLYGDVNNDGSVNMADLILLRRYFAGLASVNAQGLANADVNKDGLVNMADLIKLRRVLAGLENL